MGAPRYKIDFYYSPYASDERPFGLFEQKRVKRWFGREEMYWSVVKTFGSQAAAKVFYDTIKDLPEYLD